MAPPPSFLRGKGRCTAVALRGACSRTNQPPSLPNQTRLFEATPPFRRQWRAPCFRRDTELPDERPSGKGYRPGSYLRTSPKNWRRPLHGARIALRLAGIRFCSMGGGGSDSNRNGAHRQAHTSDGANHSAPGNRECLRECNECAGQSQIYAVLRSRSQQDALLVEGGLSGRYEGALLCSQPRT